MPAPGRARVQADGSGKPGLAHERGRGADQLIHRLRRRGHDGAVVGHCDGIPVLGESVGLAVLALEDRGVPVEELARVKPGLRDVIVERGEESLVDPFLRIFGVDVEEVRHFARADLRDHDRPVVAGDGPVVDLDVRILGREPEQSLGQRLALLGRRAPAGQDGRATDGRRIPTGGCCLTRARARTRPFSLRRARRGGSSSARDGHEAGRGRQYQQATHWFVPPSADLAVTVA